MFFVYTEALSVKHSRNDNNSVVFLLTVAEHFLQCGSVDVLKRTMPVSRAKLESEGPESLITTSSLKPYSPQISVDAAVPLTDVDVLTDMVEKTSDDDTARKTVHGQPTSVADDGSFTSESVCTGCEGASPIHGYDEVHSRVEIKVEPAVQRNDQVMVKPDEVKVESVVHSRDEVADEGDLESDNTSPRRPNSEKTYNIEETCDVNLSKHTAGELSSDSSSDLSQFEHITEPAVAATDQKDDHQKDDHQKDDQTLDSKPTVNSDSAGDVSATDVTATEPATSPMLLVRDIPDGFDEVVELYLESEKKGGGKIASFKYSRRTRSARVVFADRRGNAHFVPAVKYADMQILCKLLRTLLL